MAVLLKNHENKMCLQLCKPCEYIIDENNNRKTS